MKLIINKVINRVVQVNWLWKLFHKTIIPLAHYIKVAVLKRKVQIPTNNDFLDIFSEMKVLHGVFAGMKYPEKVAIGSMFYPKLLGSYEKEIEPILETICDSYYSEIVDIGCAEGYYAVGLAMRIKTAKIFAFDTNTEAIRLCKAMAELNGVSEKITTGTFCDADTLINLPLTEKALIFSDCEGYEKELFTNNNVPFLARHELLIEVHDFIDIEISSYLRKIFESTHIIQVFSSIDDIKKAQLYEYKELEGLSLKEKKQILSEYRPAIMEWFYLKPRK